MSASVTSTNQTNSAPLVDTVNPIARYVRNIYFQDGQLLTCILAFLLYVLVAVSLDAAGYVPSKNTALFLPVTVGAFVLSAMMAYSRFDGFFAMSHSMFTGLAWILLLMSTLVEAEEMEPILRNGIPPFQARAYLILIKWVTWVESATSGIAQNDNYVFIFEIAFLLWWLTFLGVWSILRYGYTWRAVIPAGIVLLISTNYAKENNSTVGFLVVFALVAIMLLVRTNLAEQQLRWRAHRIRFSPDISLNFLRNGLMFSVIVVAMAAIAPSLGRNILLRNILTPVMAPVQEALETLKTKYYPSLDSRTTPAGSAFGSTLPLGGARNIGNELVMQVDASAGRYWRAVTFDTFNGRGWENTSTTELELNANGVAPIGAWDLRQPLTQTITLSALTGGVIFGAPDIYSISVPVDATYNQLSTQPFYAADPDSGLDETLLAPNQSVELTYIRSKRPLDVGDSYTVVSRQTSITQRLLRDAPTDYPTEISDIYLQLPENFSERVTTTAITVTATAETVYDKTRAIETYLRGFKYNEQIDAAPEGVDPVEHFLYDIQQGYCDYYATSMAVMLRSLGIPARTASGYAEGTYDEDSRVYFITARDAHTWVEVYFPNFGWVEFEPTAGESELRRPVGTDFEETFGDDFGNPNQERPMMDNGPDLLADEPFDPATNMPEEEPFFSGSVETIRNWPWWVNSLLSLLVTLFLLGMIFYVRLLRPAAFTPDMPPILYERMLRWAERIGLRVHERNTPFEQASRLSSVLPEGQDAIHKITQQYVDYQFRPHGYSATASLGQGKIEADQSASAAELPRTWVFLQKLFMRTWMRNLGRRIFSFGSRKGKYTLVR